MQVPPERKLPTTAEVTSEHPTYIARLIVGFRDALQELEATPTTAQLERWAIFIHESMSASSRNYHSVKHVFDLADTWDDPIGIISAYFHDCIYFHVDGGFSKGQAAILKGVISSTSDGKARLNRDTDDEMLKMVLRVFGFAEDAELSPMQGLNEFLSAVIAVRELKPVLDTRILAEITCCIEATIPFRSVDSDGKTPMDRLYDRMVITNDEFKLGMTEMEIVQAVQRAALLSNRDLANFGSSDCAFFLDNTWMLLPETNETLRHQYVYTVSEFQHALVKMKGFFNFLKPNVIFADFRGVPSNEQIQSLTNQACHNLEIGRTYVGAKVVALTMLAAFAQLTGGDGPMSLFTGDLPSRHHVSRRLEDHLPEASKEGIEERCDYSVYCILAVGRKSETSFDIRQSPLAAYLYSCMGDEGIKRVLSEQTIHPMTPEGAIPFLKALPREAVLRVAQNMAHVAVSRQAKILEIIEEFKLDE